MLYSGLLIGSCIFGAIFVGLKMYVKSEHLFTRSNPYGDMQHKFNEQKFRKYEQHSEKSSLPREASSNQG